MWPARIRFFSRTRADRDADGIVRRQEEIEGLIEVDVRPVQSGWSRVSVRISNCGVFDFPSGDSGAWPAREAALRRSLVSTHAILRAPGGEFASLLDPPEELRQFVRRMLERRAVAGIGWRRHAAGYHARFAHHSLRLIRKSHPRARALFSTAPRSTKFFRCVFSRSPTTRSARCARPIRKPAVFWSGPRRSTPNNGCNCTASCARPESNHE